MKYSSFGVTNDVVKLALFERFNAIYFKVVTAFHVEQILFISKKNASYATNQRTVALSHIAKMPHQTLEYEQSLDEKLI